MNLFKFSVDTTNIFPCANSKAGGQLLTEFNLKSRESVMTDKNLSYIVGPSYVHSEDDFRVTCSTQSLSYHTDDVIDGTTRLTISSGRAIVDGHYVESLTDVEVDMLEVNRELSESQKIRGNDICIGLRINYSTEPGTSGAMVAENITTGMYEGISVVVLPKSQFHVPGDTNSRGEYYQQEQITAHIKLATFDYVNSIITNIRENADKIKFVPGYRIKDIDEILEGGYVKAENLLPNKYYVMSGKEFLDPNTGKGTRLCDATDSMMVWDTACNLKSLTPAEAAALIPSQAQFISDPSGAGVDMIIPHKQPHNNIINASTDSKDKKQYYIPRTLHVPAADYVQGTAGVVTRPFINNIKAISTKLANMYNLPGGVDGSGCVAILDTISDIGELPAILDSWKPNNYVIVCNDNTFVSGSDPAYINPPSTAYFVKRGMVEEVSETLPQGYTEGNRIDNLSYELSELFSTQSAGQAAANELKASIMSKDILRYILTNSYPDSTALNTTLYQWSNIDIGKDVYPGQDIYPSKNTTDSSGDAEYSVVLNYALSDVGERTGSLNVSTPSLVYAKLKECPNDWNERYYIDYYEKIEDMFCRVPYQPDDDEGHKVIPAWKENKYYKLTYAQLPKGQHRLFNCSRTDVYTKNNYQNYTGIYFNITRSSDNQLTKFKLKLGADISYPIELDTDKDVTEVMISFDKDLKGQIPTDFDLWSDSDKDCVCNIQVSPVRLYTNHYSNLPAKVSKGDYIQLSVRYEYLNDEGESESSKSTYKLYVSELSTSREYQTPPMILTGQVDWATTESVGGFLNIEETARDAGYVYLDDSGHLRLIDYDLLRSGTLAYQLGEDFTVPSGLEVSEIQSYLDEYVNNRVAFPLDSRSADEDAQAINVYITLPEKDTSSEDEVTDNDRTLNIYGIDSRFNTPVYLHILGTGKSEVTINIMDCEKLRIDSNIGGEPTINMYRTHLFYDTGLINSKLNGEISGVSLWYNKMYDSDSDYIYVEDMTVNTYQPTAYSQGISYFDSTNDADTHMTFALKSVSFNDKLNIVGCELLVKGARVSGLDSGEYLITDEFKLPQGSELEYPLNALVSPIVIDGVFSLCYKNDANKYSIQDIRFTATGQYIDNKFDAEGNITGRESISGGISICVNAREVVLNSSSLPKDKNGDPIYPESLPGWEVDTWHLVKGNIV